MPIVWILNLATYKLKIHPTLVKYLDSRSLPHCWSLFLQIPPSPTPGLTHCLLKRSVSFLHGHALKLSVCRPQIKKCSIHHHHQVMSRWITVMTLRKPLLNQLLPYLLSYLRKPLSLLTCPTSCLAHIAWNYHLSLQYQWNSNLISKPSSFTS